MKGIIDRFEGDMVVIEIDGVTQDIPKEKVLKESKPGDVVKLINGIWIPHKEETDKRNAKIKSLMDSVWED